MSLLGRMPVLFALLLPTVADAKLNYVATLSDDARQLRIAICTDRATSGGHLYSGYWGAARFVSDLRGDGESLPVVRRRHIEFGELAAGGCVRYTVDAYAIAQSDRYRLSWRAGQYVMLPLESWLWRPTEVNAGSTLDVQLPAGWTASLPYAPIDATRYRLAHTPVDWDGTSVFGRLQQDRVQLPGGELRVSILPTSSADVRQRVLAWVDHNATALLSASGRLPLSSVQVLVVPLPGVSTPVPWGQALRGGGSALKLFVGLDASERALLDDWTLAHEFSHLLHPYLRTRGRWLSEGLASYYQNVLRARSGALTAEQAWEKLDAGFVRGSSERSAGQSLADAATGGYRNTMRVYWSGAAFWLEAELALRQSTGADLAQVLDAFARRHFPTTTQWEPERFMLELDAIVGAKLFAPLFARYDNGTRFPSLSSTYRQLGLGQGAGQLSLSGQAPRVDIREAIMRTPAEQIGKSQSSGQRHSP